MQTSNQRNKPEATNKSEAAVVASDLAHGISVGEMQTSGDSGAPDPMPHNENPDLRIRPQNQAVPDEKEYQLRLNELEQRLAEQTEERIRAEHTLLALQNALDRVRDGIMITEPVPLDEPGPRITYVNAALRRFSGYAADELIGSSPQMLQGSETSRATLNLIRDSLETLKPSSVEIVNYTKQGVAYWTEIDISPVFDEAGQCLSFVLVQRDMTEHRSIIEALQRERDFNTAIIQTSPTLFGVIDADGRVLLMNPALIAQLGDAADPLIGKNWLAARFLVSGERRALVKLARTLIQEKKPALVETQLQLPDGRDVLIGWRITPVLNPSGQLDFVFFSGADITAKRKAEEAQQRMEDWLRQSNQILEQRVQERTRDLSNLLHSSQIINSTLALEPLLEFVMDQLKEVVGYTTCMIMKSVGTDPLVFESLGHRNNSTDQTTTWWRYDLEHDLHIRPVLEHQVSIIEDLQGDSPEAISYRNNYVANNWPPPTHVRSWMAVPLIARGQLIGILVVRERKKNYYRIEQASLTQTFANQVAVALENARLFQAEQAGREEANRRRQVAEGLGDIVATLNSNRSLEQTLDFILGQAMQLLGAASASIYQLQQPQNVFRTKVSRGFAVMPRSNIVIPFGEGLISQAVQAQRPLWLHLDETTEWIDIIGPDGQSKHLSVAHWLTENFGTMLNVPVYIKGAPYGAIGLYYTDQRKLSEEELALAMMIADQMALAIENAELRASSAQAAAMAERSRLARELHDSVSQALFGISLGTRTSLELLNTDPAKARDPMDYVLQLADAGMAEMRALIFELRPESLQSEGLHVAFRKQAAALVARHKIHMSTILNGAEDDLPINVKEALYRIGLEAIQNTIKHAQATHVVLTLDRGADGSVILEICDDGIGFNANKAFPGHFGLKTMHERAEMLNGQLEVTHAPSRGTCIRVVIPMPLANNENEIDIGVAPTSH